jgi:uncharacterized phage-associated protein
MKRFNFNQKKAFAAMLYVASNLTWANFHKVHKIIYFADLMHLAKYGRPITGDRYIAMKNGPVASWIKDVMHKKVAREYWKFFTVVLGFVIRAKRPPNLLDHFSKTDIACLDESLAENRNLSYSDLTTKSHDEAWKNTIRDREISVDLLISVSKASEKMTEYIKEREANRTFQVAQPL